MPEIKEKHPSWFKLKIERRQLIKQLPPETAVNVLLACWEYLETCEIPDTLQPLEKIAFSAFFPDMEEAWQRYEQRVNAKRNKSVDIISNGANLKNTLLLIAGIVATGLGFFFLTGSVIPLVIAGIAAVVVAVLGLTGNLEEFCQNFKENILGGLIDFITGVFTGDWTKAWEGIKKVFKGIWNGIVMILESAVNLIIKGINWLIGKLNSLLENSLLAKGLDLIGIEFRGIPQIPEVHIPRLAQGAVIPPNREFMAVLGDQKSGTNIETPLATMVQAFKQALAESGYGGSNEAVLVLDKEVLGKVVYRLNKAEGTRIGVNLAEI